MTLRFYRLAASDPRPAAGHVVSAPYRLDWWRPGLLRAIPPGCRPTPALVWWACHYAGVFRNRGYQVAAIVHDATGRASHRSSIFPGYFRFPFMDRDDLQVGDTWTAEDQRGRGLASGALRAIAERFHGARTLWYLTTEANTASCAVAERCGFRLAGTGAKLPRLGLGVLGSYVITAKQS